MIFCLQVVVAAEAVPVATDGDHDGIPDHRDQCRQTAQITRVPAGFKYSEAFSSQSRSAVGSAWPVDGKGCELDSDGDGLVDSRDYCPDDAAQTLVAGITALGCPLHSDADGTPDWRDHCPGTPRGIPTDQFGCPKV